MKRTAKKANNNKDNKKKLNDREIENVPQAIALKVIEKIEGIPKNIKLKLVRVIKQEIIEKREYFSGPLPSPKIMQQYDKMKGVLNHIISSAKKEQIHRHSLERKQVDIFCESIKYSDRTERIIAVGAQLCATVIVISFLIAGVILAIKGITWPAIGALGTSIGGVVSLIITGKKKEKKPPREYKKSRPKPA